MPKTSTPQSTAIGIPEYSKGATRLVSSADPARDGRELERDLADIETSAATAMTAVRRVVGLLRGDDSRPARDQVLDLVARFERRGPAQVSVEVADDMDTWPADVGTAVTRVVQEALTNVTLHAPGARTVAVTVRADSARVQVEVVDDAATPDSGRLRGHRRRGYGLEGLGERVTALGGRLSAQPRPGRGWAVNAELPLGAGAGRR